MKKKADLTSVYDELRNEDPKKRLQSVLMLKELATGIGAQRVRNELLNFLNQFIDDDQNIVVALFQQLEDFRTILGGSQYSKHLLPLLISFCRIDQKVQADSAMKIIIPILQINPDCIIDTIKKLIKNQMVIARDCAHRIIVELIQKNNPLEANLLQIYNTGVFSENPGIRKISAKYLRTLLKNIKNKEQAVKMIEVLSNDSDDLPKLLVIDTIVDFYEYNSTYSLNKLKNLLSLNQWRINLKFCESMETINKKFTKIHYRSVIEPFFIKFFTSIQPQVRAASCYGLITFTKNLSEDELRSKLIQNLKALSIDSSSFVKMALAENILKICQFLPKQIINQFILPIAIQFMEDNQFQYSLGIMNNFQIFSNFISQEIFQNKILKTINSHFLSDNWRLKCKAIDLISKILQNPLFLRQKTIKTIFDLVADKVDAVRKKIIDLIIDIIKKQSSEWNDVNIIPHLTKFRQHPNYLHRQTFLLVIQKTVINVSQRTFNDIYRNTINGYLVDKVPNIRFLALNVVRDNPILIDKNIEDTLRQLKQDKDTQVKILAKAL